MNDTHGLPMKFVFHVTGAPSAQYMFDLTQWKGNSVLLLDWFGDRPGAKEYWGWEVEKVAQNIQSGGWIIDAILEDESVTPELEDLL